MPNYQDARIYCIRAPGTDDTYIGSTTRPLSERMAGHRKQYKQWKNETSNYMSSFKLIENEDAYIELIEEFPCDTREQLHRREGEVIRETANCINKKIAGRTQAEYVEANREKINERCRNYYQANREEVDERNSRYRETHREQINERQRARYQARKAAQPLP